MVKSLPAMPETQVRSLGWEDSLEKETANHSSILAWKIPWTEEPGYSPWDHKESDTTEQLQSKKFFKGQPFNITVIQTYAPTTDAEEAEVDQIYEDLQGLLELTEKKRSFPSWGIGMQK